MIRSPIAPKKTRYCFSSMAFLARIARKASRLWIWAGAAERLSPVVQGEMMDRPRRPSRVRARPSQDLSRSVDKRADAGQFANAVAVPGLIHDDHVDPTLPETPSVPPATPFAVIRRISANRVEYQHNRKIETDPKGVVKHITAPVDISFGTDEHSTYFARERRLDQLAGLRTIRWHMKDDFFKAAYYHAYQGKPVKGKAKDWLAEIEEAKAGRMSASDGHSLSTDTKKKAPHFDEAWGPILNRAVEPGSGTVEDSEAEMRDLIKGREQKAQDARDKRAIGHLGTNRSVWSWFSEDSEDDGSIMALRDVPEGFRWRELKPDDE